MKKIVIAILLVSMTFTGYESFAQRRGQRGSISKFKGFRSRFDKSKQFQTLGISVSAVNYFGDITPSSGALSTDISFTRPAIGLEYTRRLGPRYEIRGAFTFATLRGDDFTFHLHVCYRHPVLPSPQRVGMTVENRVELGGSLWRLRKRGQRECPEGCTDEQ